MAKRPTQSRLQNKILGYLSRQQVHSISSLASEIASHRSSVSRAIHALESAGLASKSMGAWTITSKGRRELRQVQDRVAEQATTVSAALQKLLSSTDLAIRATSQNLELDKIISASSVIQANGLFAGVVEDSLKSIASITANLNLYNYAIEIPNGNLVLEATSGLFNSDAFGSLKELASESARLINASGAIELASVEDQLKGLRAGLDVEIKFPAGLGYLATLRNDTESQIANTLEALARPAASVASLHTEPWFQSAAAVVSLGIPHQLHAIEELNASLYQSAVHATKLFSAQPSFLEIAANDVLQVQAGATLEAIANVGSRLAQETLFSITQGQRLSIASMQHAASFGMEASAAVEALGRVNVELGGAVIDAGEIFTNSYRFAERAAEAASVIPNLAGVARTYAGYLADTVADLPAAYGEGFFNANLIAPSHAVSSYVGAAKSFLVQPDKQESTPSPEYRRRELWLEHGISLENLFSSHGPTIVAMWRGSWDVLDSDSADRVRQAAHSGRELLMQILAVLAPDSTFDTAEIRRDGQNGKVTRRMRVRKIAGGSNSAMNFADALASALESLYDRLAAVSHDRQSEPIANDKQVVGLLHALGGLLAFLVGLRRQD